MREAHRALLYLPPVLKRGCEGRVDTRGQALSHTHPQRRPALRTAGTLQGVPPSWFERRVAGGVCSTGKRHGQAACEPGVEGAGQSLTILPDYTPTVRPPPKRC
jgi:hypothetical protein